MIVGLLNVQSPKFLRIIEETLAQSGLLEAIDKVYYSRLPLSSKKGQWSKDDLSLYLHAKFTPNAKIWSISTVDFDPERESSVSWLKYVLYFLVGHWKLAVEKLEEYQAYGVQLHSAPEVHFANYCFWMTSQAMSEVITKPYCVFQSFVNHYTTPFPLEEYRDFDRALPAPLNNSKLISRIAEVAQGDPNLISLGNLALLLLFAKNYFLPQPFRESSRPYVLTDIDHSMILLFLCKIGRIDLYQGVNEDLLYQLHLARLQGYDCNNIALAPEGKKVDIIYTTLPRVEKWLPFLSSKGVMIVKEEEGVIPAGLIKRVVGGYYLLAQEEYAFQLL